MIVIDGSEGEGGGQIIRTALALSALTNQPFSVESIRRNRPNPGLKAQHLSGILALQKLCGAEVEGAEEGSMSFTFRPGTFQGKTISVDIGTAGSMTLFFQSVLLPALFADQKTHFRVKGGTDTKWAVPIDFFTNVIMPHLQRFAEVECEVSRRGYYPAGGGLVELWVKPRFHLSQFPNMADFLSFLRVQHIQVGGEGFSLVNIAGMSHASTDLQKAEVAERQARSAKVALLKLGLPVHIGVNYSKASSPGSGITLWATYSKGKGDTDSYHPIVLGADVLGERGKRAEAVGDEAANKLIGSINAGYNADPNLADNLVPLLALAGGSLKTQITEHTKTNIAVTERFLPVKFNISPDRISC